MENPVSQLGASGQPHARLWNLIGFVGVGTLLAMFGFAVGRNMQDKWMGGSLTLFGLAFALAAIPADLRDFTAVQSRVHVVAILSALGFWALAMWRLLNLPAVGERILLLAGLALALVFVAIAVRALELLPMAVTQRLCFGIVFGWVAAMSILLLRHTP